MLKKLRSLHLKFLKDFKAAEDPETTNGLTEKFVQDVEKLLWDKKQLDKMDSPFQNW